MTNDLILVGNQCPLKEVGGLYSNEHYFKKIIRFTNKSNKTFCLATVL